MRVSKRDQLIEMAVELFFRNGCHTTGIDTLLAKAGVAKMTLYAHFKSKDELILAAAERVHEEVALRLKQIFRDDAGPREQLRRLFDFFDETVACKEYGGYVFHKLATEFSDPDHPVHCLAKRHTALIESYIHDALIRGNAPEPRALAQQLMALGEGGKVLVQLTGDRSYAGQARVAADRMVDAALSGSASPPSPLS